MFAIGENRIERAHNPFAICARYNERRQKLYRATAVASDLAEDFVVLKEWHRNELTEQTLFGGLQGMPGCLEFH